MRKRFLVRLARAEHQLLLSEVSCATSVHFFWRQTACCAWYMCQQSTTLRMHRRGASPAERPKKGSESLVTSVPVEALGLFSFQAPLHWVVEGHVRVTAVTGNHLVGGAWRKTLAGLGGHKVHDFLAKLCQAKCEHFGFDTFFCSPSPSHGGPGAA